MAAMGFAACADGAGTKDGKEIVRRFLTSFEAATGAPLGLVDGAKFVQHNPRVKGEAP
jgi:hypothetical protein